jgi:hypothetical protein
MVTILVFDNDKGGIAIIKVRPVDKLPLFEGT